MNCTLEKKFEFKKHCPQLSHLIDVIKKFTNPKVSATASIKRSINYNNWDDMEKTDVALLKTMLKNLKLPTYENDITKNTIAITSVTIPENINVLTREIHFQKVALEALAKQRIAEQNLQTVISILGQFLPSDFDLDSYLIKNNEPSSQKINLTKKIN